MKRSPIEKTIAVAAALAAAAVFAAPVVWEFPRTGSCHEGLAFSDGKTGVLVWGGGDTLNVTVGRGDMWDHRGGYPWTEEQNYTNMVALTASGRFDGIAALFRKDTPPGEPRNPYMLPLGRVAVKIPGAELKRGELDPYTGLASIEFAAGGETKRVYLAMCKPYGGVFEMKFPAGSDPSVETKTAMEFPRAKKELEALGIKPAEKRDSAAAGGLFWRLPVDKPAWLAWAKKDGTLAVRTGRGDAVAPADMPRFEDVQAASRAQWAAFWREGARVKVPDPVLQTVFEYGMYRYGAMTDPDGFPAGLQGPWLEDDRLVPWNGDYHFNVNVQECYSPSFRGGHFKNLMPMFKMILSWRPRLRDNAQKFVGIDDGYSLPHSVDDRGVNIGGFWSGTIDHGSTAWVADMMMRYVRFSGDVAFLKDGAYDFMNGAMRVYRKMMAERPDGRLTLPLGSSPEWAGAGRDSSFQLAAAHRLLIDLEDAAKMLGEKPDPMWLDVRKRLPKYTKDKDSGIAIYENTILSRSHRHHSHLAGLYPFNTIDMLPGAERRDADRAYRWWVQKGPGEWSGWCVPWASILHTHFGNADAAVHAIHSWKTFFNNPGHGSLHDAWRAGYTVMMGRPYVMQMDGACGAATAVMEMLAHETGEGGRTEFFRGCPDSWKEVSFENFALPDGTRVNGRRINGKVSVEKVK